MRPIRRRTVRTLATAAVVPLLVLTASCGSGDDDSSSSDDSSQTESSAPDAEGSTTSAAPVGEDVDAKDFAQQISDTFTDVGTAHVEMKLTNAGLVMTAKGQVDYSADQPRMAMTMSAPAFGDQAIEARVVDGVMYMAMPMLGAGTEDVFYKIDLDDPNSPLADSMGGLSSFDPKSTVEMFGQGLEKVTLVGDDSVDGVATKHYVVTTNTEEFKKSLGEQGSVVPDDLTYDVWLDDQGRLAKMEADLDAQGSLELTMSKWDQPVTIVAPPANKVQDFPEGATAP